jgi:plastocyanin
MSSLRVRGSLLLILTLGLLVVILSNRLRAGDDEGRGAAVQVLVPNEDRFIPFAITVHVGQKVTWTNTDADDHTIVSDDAFNTAGHRGVNMVLKANGGKFTLRFNHPGVFPYYCRFHAMLDTHNQPKAPGPNGGIQDTNGNYGTPMSGVVTVVEDD